MTRYDVETGGEITTPDGRFIAAGRRKNAGERPLFHTENLVIRPGAEILDVGALTHIRRCWRRIQTSQEQRNEEKTKPADDHDIGQTIHRRPYSGKISASQVRFNSGCVRAFRGNALTRVGWEADALGEFAQAVRLSPKLADAHLNFGVALARNGRYSEAVTEFRETLRLRPQDERAQGMLDQALRLAGKDAAGTGRQSSGSTSVRAGGDAGAPKN